MSWTFNKNFNIYVYSHWLLAVAQWWPLSDRVWSCLETTIPYGLIQSVHMDAICNAYQVCALGSRYEICCNVIFCNDQWQRHSNSFVSIHVESDRLKIPNEFDKYFSKFGNGLTSKIAITGVKDSSKHHLWYILNNQFISIFLHMAAAIQFIINQNWVINSCLLLNNQPSAVHCTSLFQVTQKQPMLRTSPQDNDLHHWEGTGGSPDADICNYLPPVRNTGIQEIVYQDRRYKLCASFIYAVRKVSEIYTCIPWLNIICS